MKLPWYELMSIAIHTVVVPPDAWINNGVILEYTTSTVTTEYNTYNPI